MSPTDGSTDPGRWERVQDLFVEALELEGAERAAYLDAACGDDEALREEVESLLGAAGESDAYFGDLADRAGITLSTDTRDATGARREGPSRDSKKLVGQKIGQYTVLEWLGQGGMAAVFLAEREGDGFTQRVALKLVNQRVSDPLIQRRSNEERRILARLEHRSIARLIDGGMTPQGFPYYAMEYVEGSDVLTYCDDHRLSTRDRLDLFLEVCVPVQFAHERLVIHCDLKPSNIFVTADGHVKLLDFGVARLIDPESAGSGTTGLWFTPAYASPEQVRREPPGTASDVYSLGVLLYELLTGHRPYRFGSYLQGEIAKTVGEVTPPNPSSVVTQPGSASVDGVRREIAAADLASRRGLTPGELKKELRGDLDAIVMKALAKDAEDRYHTAEQLAADIRRHLDHKLVRSVPATPAYRARKFVRRNRGAVGAAALAFLAVSVGVGGTLWQASRARIAAENAAVEAEKAQRVAELMAELFRLSDPSQSLGNEVTARDLLDAGTERILSEFGDQPVVQADLLTEVARIYNNLGVYGDAEPLVERALVLRESEFGPLSLEASESLINLGVLKANQSDPNEAIELLSRAIDIREPLVEGPDSLVVEAKSTLGWAVRKQGEHDRAARLFAEALDEQRAIDPSAGQIANLMFGQASSLHDDGMLDAADSVFNEVLANLDPDARPTPDAVSALQRVGMVRRLREQYRDANPLLEQAVAFAEGLYGPNHGTTLNAERDLLLNQAALGDWATAEAGYRDAVQRSIVTLGPGHEVTARLQEGLAGVLEDLGRYGEAIELQELSLQEKVLRHENRDHPGVVGSLISVGRVLTLAGRHREAMDYLNQAIAMNERLGSTRGSTAMATRRALGIMATMNGEYAEAEEHFVEAIAMGEEFLTRPSHRYLTAAKTEYATMLVESGRGRDALEMIDEIEPLVIDRLGTPHPRVDQLRALRARAASD